MHHSGAVSTEALIVQRGPHAAVDRAGAAVAKPLGGTERASGAQIGAALEAGAPAQHYRRQGRRESHPPSISSWPVRVNSRQATVDEKQMRRDALVAAIGCTGRFLPCGRLSVLEWPTFRARLVSQGGSPMKLPIAVCASVLTVLCLACGGSPGRDQCTKSSDCPADGLCSQGLCQIGFKLTASKTGSGSGTVTSSPAGIDCGTTCSASYASGAVVRLTAAPAAGSIFAGWSGDCTGTATTASVTTSASKSCTASFTFNTSCTPPGNPTVAASALVNPPPAAPPAGTCNKTVRTSQFPPAQIAALSPSQAPYRVGTIVSFRVPQGTGSLSIVSQAVSAPDAITFQSNQIPNTVVPTLVKAPDGSTIYDDNVNPPQDPSGQQAFYGGSSPSTGAFTLPNATPLLQSSAASGLAAGTWQFTVNDFEIGRASCRERV